MSEKTKLKGRLFYLGWFAIPWKLVTDDSCTLDLWPHVDEVLKSLNGKRAGHKNDGESYTLAADKTSRFRLEYEPGERVGLIKEKGIGFSNVHAYLDEVFIWLSGRLVEAEFGNGYFNIHADPSEKVFGVYFTGEGNSCRIPDGMESGVCKIGQGKETCIFAALSGRGFLCEKFSGHMARMFLDRLAKGTIRAGRIGNCAVLGRKD